MRTAIGLAAAALLIFAAQGTRAQCCGDCSGDGEVTVDEIITSVNRALDGCADDGVCDASVAECSQSLAGCESDLADCRAGQGGLSLLATGQTESYGPGSDGDMRAGAALAYRDNGDGTITDLNAGLMWEKKDHSGGIHDVDNGYTCGMTNPPYTMNGTMVTEFLAALNTVPCLAGYCDWRIPNRRELESIVDASRDDPAIAPVFNNNCTPGCTVTECSCTASTVYWSSTTNAGLPPNAWVVGFYSGNVFYFNKDVNFHVRAVRGGL